MPQTQTDHDLLIELRTEMRGVRDDIKRLQDGTAVTLADHETRIRNLEKSGERWLGKQSVIGAAVGSAVSIAGSILSAGKW